MLSQLHIKNYALIRQLTIPFEKGLNTITGETGAGKSIILGALSLILGKRADLSTLKDKEKKCVVEGIFQVKNYQLEPFFTEYDLDYEDAVILRREILPSGKSRAFINDTPVNLKVMQLIGNKLIDIHSQHQNLTLSDNNFQLELIDAVAGTFAVLSEYKKIFDAYTILKKELKNTEEKAAASAADIDYYQFQYEQLETANLVADEQEKLEVELEKLNHAEEIKSNLESSIDLIDNEHASVLSALRQVSKNLSSIEDYLPDVTDLRERIESARIELEDVKSEFDDISQEIEHDSQRIEFINDRLGKIYELQQKHRVDNVASLIEIKNDLDEKLQQITGYDDEIAQLKKQLENCTRELEQLATQLTKKRKKASGKIESTIEADLKKLGIKNAVIKVEHSLLQEFTSTGKDAVSLLFSANIDTEPTEVAKIASGGEISRLMLSIKNLLRKTKVMPTVIFDEIDTGVSGEIAMKMGNIIESFSTDTQVINITHLPQIAAKGNAHFVVEKNESTNETVVTVKKLDPKERVEELAKMLGGVNLTDTTLKAAIELLHA